MPLEEMGVRPPRLQTKVTSGKKRNLPLKKSCRALFGTHTFGSHPPPKVDR